MEYDYSKLFLDTNILVYATLKDFDEEKHHLSVKFLKHLYRNNKKQLIISTQILREFYAVVTNPKYLKKPLIPEQAINQINYFKSVFMVLPVGLSVIDELEKLLTKYQITGQNIHDTTIVATMNKNKIKTIASFNTSDFNKFKEIDVIKPV